MDIRHVLELELVLGPQEGQTQLRVHAPNRKCPDL